jgi:ABC-type methionine transport system permease subunit
MGGETEGASRATGVCPYGGLGAIGIDLSFLLERDIVSVCLVLMILVEIFSIVEFHKRT